MNDAICKYCGAQKKISLKGKLYCPNICWKKPEVIAKEKLEYELEGVIMEWEHGDYGCRD